MKPQTSEPWRKSIRREGLSLRRRREARTERQRLALIALLHEAYDGEGRPAGPTTDAVTVATRLMETGRIYVDGAE